MGLYENSIGMILSFKSNEMYNTKDLKSKDNLKTYSNYYDLYGVKYHFRISSRSFWNKNVSNTKSKHSRKDKNAPKKEEKTILQLPLITPANITGEKLDVDVIKKGGNFKLVGGMTMTVDESSFMKKVTITSTIVPTNKRHDFQIDLEYQDCLLSDIILVFSKYFTKKPIKYFIPSFGKVNKFTQLIYCHNDKFEWNQMEKFQRAENGINFQSMHWGLYALIQRRPFDEITITRAGGIFYPKVHPLISIRIPKTACPIEQDCFIQYFETDPETINNFSQCYPSDLGNFNAISQMFSFIFPMIVFKRPVTIKLPLPEWVESILAYDTSHAQLRLSKLQLYRKSQGIWDLVDTHLYFTRNTFSFDTTALGTFVLIDPKPTRENRIKQSLSRMEHINNIKRGAALVFLQIDVKTWYLIVELVEFSRIPEIRELREKAGFIFIEQAANKPKPEIEVKDKKKRRVSYLVPKSDCGKILELSEGLICNITITGCIKIKASSIVPPLVSKQFNKSLMSILRRQTDIADQMAQHTNVLVEEPELEHADTDEDEDMTFLNKFSSSKNIAALGNLSTEEADLFMDSESGEENMTNTVSIVYHSQLPINCRILEIEPIKDKKFNQIIKEHIKQKIIYLEDLTSENEDVEENKEEIKSNLTEKSVTKDIDAVETSPDASPNIENDELDCLKGLSEESLKRTYIKDEQLRGLMLNGFVKIRRNVMSLQVPPNQITNEIVLDKTKSKISQDQHREMLISYLNNDLTKIKFKYEIYLDPEEFREYLGLSRPTNNDLLITRHENQQRNRNPYLDNADTDISEEVEAAKGQLISTFVDKSLTNKPNTQSTSPMRQSQTGGVYKEPKTLNLKSLQILSLYIEQGLSLAVHLGISDSIITAIGFTSLSSNLTLAEVSYKVLQQWNKQTKGLKRSLMLVTLCQALKNIELLPLGNLIEKLAANDEPITQQAIESDPEVLKIVNMNVDISTIERMESIN